MKTKRSRWGLGSVTARVYIDYRTMGDVGGIVPKENKRKREKERMREAMSCPVLPWLESA